jgi:hypothetical protein
MFSSNPFDLVLEYSLILPTLAFLVAAAALLVAFLKKGRWQYVAYLALFSCTLYELLATLKIETTFNGSLDPEGWGYYLSRAPVKLAWIALIVTTAIVSAKLIRQGLLRELGHKNPGAKLTLGHVQTATCSISLLLLGGAGLSMISVIPPQYGEYLIVHVVLSVALLASGALLLWRYMLRP